MFPMATAGCEQSPLERRRNELLMTVLIDYNS